MIEIVINYNKDKDEFMVYEQKTDTILVSKTLTEALVNLSNFLVSKNLIKTDILNCSDISYHFDSETMKRMIESNVNLMKRLSTAPSGFALSSQRFGTSISQSNSSKNYNKDLEKQKYKFSSNNFTGKNGFSSSMKKFGGK